MDQSNVWQPATHNVANSEESMNLPPGNSLYSTYNNELLLPPSNQSPFGVNSMTPLTTHQAQHHLVNEIHCVISEINIRTIFLIEDHLSFI